MNYKKLHPHILLMTLFCLFMINKAKAQNYNVIEPSPEHYSSKALQTENRTTQATPIKNSNATNSQQLNRAFNASSNKIGTANQTDTNCYIPPDATYTNFPGNDDGSVGPIALPFTFSLYGVNYTSVYINNNGNLTFTAPSNSFDPVGFPTNIPMVAPFWADVDTRVGNTVKFKVNLTNLIVTWPGVGYYNQKTNLLNTFQVIITNGNDSLIGLGNNVAFYYGDMQWTTGDANTGSGAGVNGFGGVPATAGINQGDGINYIQIGRFNANNSTYTGPLSLTSGINYLDLGCFPLTAGSLTNLAPSVSGVPANNTLNIACGETGTINLTALPPEVGQNVSVVVDTGGLCNTTIVNATSGTSSNATVSIVGGACNVGSHNISFVFTDNFNPSESTTVNVTVVIGSAPVISCPANVTVSNTSGLCGANVTYPAATATGTSPTFTYSHPSGSFFPIGTTTVTATAINACGADACTFTVTVNDTQAPTITCPANIVVSNAANQCGANVTFAVNATDNCYTTNDVKWTLNGVTFTDGGTATGSFFYNAAANAYSNWNISVNGGGASFPALAYNIGSSTQAMLPNNGFMFTLNSSTRALRLSTASPKTNAGGTLPLDFVNNSAINVECYNCVPYRLINAGSLVGTPMLTITQTAGLPSGSLFPVGTTTNTFVVTDIGGNTNTCSFTVTVNDTQAPTINCPANITVNNATNQCGANVSFAATATDNCGTANITYSPASGSFFSIGTTTVTATADDGHGNTSSCTFTVTVNDTQPPVITCPGNKVLPVGSNCLVALPDYVTTSTVTLSVRINSGSSNTSCVFDGGFDFTPEPKWKVNINNQGWVIYPSSGLCYANTPNIQYTQTYNCSSTYPSAMQVCFSAFEDDGAGCVANETCAANICQVFSVPNPGDSQTYFLSIPSSAPSWGDVSFTITATGSFNSNCPAATDNCSATVTQSPPPGTLLAPGNHTVTLNATDPAGNTDSCTFNVNVIDTTPPVINCPANITNVIATSANGAVVNYVTPVGGDNCAGSTTTRIAGLASGSVFPIGTTTVTHRVTNASGATAQCSFTVTVVGVAPQIVCPANITVNNDTNKCGAIVNFAATETVGIPASNITYSHASGSLFPIGTTTVTATATNTVGSSSCTFTVTVNDTQPPSLAIVAPVPFAYDQYGRRSTLSNINLGGTGTNAVRVAPSAPVTLSFSRSTVLTGACPGCITQHYVGIAGVWSSQCLFSTTGATSGNHSYSFTAPSAPGVYYITIRGSWEFSCIPVAMPSGPNEAFAVLIVGNSSLCPENVVVNNDLNQCGAVVSSPNPSIVDNCPGGTVVQTTGLPSGSLYPVGTTVNTFVATDASGNTATCSYSVTVNDTQPPVINCPANIVTTNTTNQCGKIVTFAATASDNCGTANITYSPASGTFFAVGTTTVTATADDGHGNTSSCTFTVTVNDNQPPVINCPANINADLSAGQCGAFVSFAATASDNCGTANITYSHASGSLFSVGTTTVTATADDGHGNTSSCTFTVTVDLLDHVNLQWPPDATICPGGSFTAYGQVYEPNVTTVSESQGANIEVQFGYSTTNSNPSGWSNWFAASFNQYGGNPNNDEYYYNFSSNTPGTYYYTFRYRQNGCAWQYGGFKQWDGGTWDGVNNVSGVLTVQSLDWANLQWPPTATICQGSSITAYGQVYEAGVTPGAGSQGAGIEVQFGYSNTNNNPSGWSNWSPALFNQFGGGFANDEYYYNFTPPTHGTYYYTFRYRLNGCAWQYGGYSSGGGLFWDGFNFTSGRVIVDPTTVGGNVTGGTSICPGETSALLTLSGYTGAILGWESSVFPFLSWDPIGNNNHTYTSGPLSETTKFRAIIQSGVCPSITSGETTVIVYLTYPFYADNDNDGYGAGPVQYLCSDSANNPPAGYRVDGTDCDDTKADRHQTYPFYVDNDGDGYGREGSTAVQLCAVDGNTPPLPNYSVNDDDCNDGVFAIHPGVYDIPYDSIDNNCDGSLYDGHAPIIVHVLSPSCGGINHGLNNTINCTEVYLGPGYVIGYRFKVTNLITGEVDYVDTVQHHFKLTDTDIYAYGTPYSIQATAIVNGEVQPFNGPTCTLTTTSVATTKVVTAQCGSTLTLMISTINANSVNSALAYRFRVARADAPNVYYYTGERSVPNFNLTMLSAPDGFLTYATEYRVDVQIKIKLANIIAWSQFGQTCSIFTPVPPTSSIVSSQCELVATSNTQVINATPFTGATLYRFLLTHYDEFGNIDYEQYQDSPTPSFTLSMFSGLLPNTTYNVAVSMKLYGSFVPYDKECSVTTPDAVRATLQIPFSATAYPNPYSNHFMIDVKTADAEAITIKVFDMVGRLVEQRLIQVNDLGNSPIGERYPSGVYNIVVSQGEEVQTVRIVKR